MLVLVILIVELCFFPAVSNYNLNRQKKCELFCQMMQMEQYCDHCKSRMPVRFGKRSREIQVNLKTTGEGYDNCAYLMDPLFRKHSSFIEQSIPIEINL